MMVSHRVRERRTRRLSYVEPDLVASRLLNRGQSTVLPVLAIIVGCTLVAAPLQTVLAFNALATGLYVLAFIYGIYLVQRSLAVFAVPGAAAPRLAPSKSNVPRLTRTRLLMVKIAPVAGCGRSA